MNKEAQIALQIARERAELQRQLDHAIDRLAALKTILPPPGKRQQYTEILARLAEEIGELEDKLKILD